MRYDGEMTAERADVVVIGLGVTGLSTAGALAHRGHRRRGDRPVGKHHPVDVAPPARRGPSGSRTTTSATCGSPGRRSKAGIALKASQHVTLLLETGQVDLGPDAKLDALAAAMRAG